MLRKIKSYLKTIYGLLWIVRIAKRHLGIILEKLIISSLKVLFLCKVGKISEIKCVLVNGERIGPLAERVIYAIRECDLDTKKSYHWVCLADDFANYDLAKILSRYVPIIRWRAAFNAVLNYQRRTGEFPNFIIENSFTDEAKLNLHSGKIVELSDSEINRGEYLLKQLYGIGKDDWFVCFHARDTAYLDALKPKTDWTYHNYRNSNISNCSDAISEVVSKGGFAIRIGSKVHEALETKNSKQIIDYANDCPTSFLDVYLLSRCKFAVIGGGSGIGFTAQAFGTPVIWTNFIPIYPWPWDKKDIFLPKLIFSIKLKRLLTFKEMHDWGFFDSKSEAIGLNYYKNNYFKTIENSQNDILSACQEMLNQLNRRTEPTQIKKFKSEFRNKYANDRFSLGNISGQFLLKYQKLL